MFFQLSQDMFSSAKDLPFRIAVIDQLPNFFTDCLTQCSSHLTGVYDRVWLPSCELPVASRLSAIPMSALALPSHIVHAAHSSVRTALTMPSLPQLTALAMPDPALSYIVNVAPLTDNLCLWSRHPWSSTLLGHSCLKHAGTGAPECPLLSNARATS